MRPALNSREGRGLGLPLILLLLTQPDVFLCSSVHIHPKGEGQGQWGASSHGSYSHFLLQRKGCCSLSGLGVFALELDLGTG